MSKDPLPMRGIVGFPLAPFREDLSLDIKALERDVDELSRHPFCALNAPAGISEVFSLSVDEAVEMVRTTVRVVAGRMPVIGCVCYSATVACEMARRMEDAGAGALLVLPPYYAGAPFEGLIAYYRAVANSTGLPLAIYSRGWASFSAEEVDRLASEIPTLRFWKDGQADLRNLQRIRSRVGDRLVWIGGAGDDCAAGYAAIGLDVFTSSISALAPALTMAWGDAALARDFPRLNGLLEEYVHPLFAIRTRRRGYEVTAMKEMAALLGRPVGEARPPLPPLGPSETADLQRVLESWRPFL